MSVANIGAAFFGLVVGWVTYRTLRRKGGNVGLSDLSTIIGVIGGAAITTPFKEPVLFGSYAIGLAIGFFAYFIVALILEGRTNTVTWMGGKQ